MHNSMHLSRSAIVKSLEQLFLLGALTDECKLSDPVGHQMARLPLDPIYSKALILASESKCLEEMLITVAMLSVESIFYAPREKLEEVCAQKILFLDVFVIYRDFTSEETIYDSDDSVFLVYMIS